MLPLLLDSFNTLTQSSYDLAVSAALKQRQSIACPCCGKNGTLSKYAYYLRYYGENNTQLKILRLFCKDCKTTHALLPVNITAYSQIPTHKACLIIYQKMIEGLPFSHLANSHGLQTKRIKSIITRFRQEYMKLHIDFFGSLHKILTLSSIDICHFFNQYKLMYLVNKHKLKNLYIKPHPVIIELNNP